MSFPKHWVSLCLFLACLLQSASSQTTGISNHIQRGEAAIHAKDFATATTEFQVVLVLDPKNVEANANLGVIAFARGDYKTAVRTLRTALAERPTLLQSRALLAISEKRLGDPSAQTSLEKAFAKLTDTKLRTQVGMELAGLYQSQGDTEHAIPVVQKLVQLNPDDADILYIAQRLYRQLADDTLNKLAVEAPGSARMQQAIAQRLVNQGDLPGAAEHYRKTLEIDPNIPGVHYELGEAIFEATPGDAAVQSEAEKELQTAITLDGDSAAIQCELGKIAMAQSDLAKALTHYRRAFALDSSDPTTQIGMGRLLMTMNNPGEAKKYLELAVKSDPLNESAHYRLATVYRTLQMHNQAEKEFHLFEEIKKTKAQVEDLYRQMNVKPKATSDEVLDLTQ